MLPYIISYILLCLMAVAYVRMGKYAKKTAFLLGCGIILFLVCCRDISVGADTGTYWTEFRSISNHSWRFAIKHRWESGYTLVNKALSYLIDTPQKFIIGFGLINLLPVFYLIKKKMPYPAMSLVIFYVLFLKPAEFLYRQWLAVLVLFVAHKFVVERKPIKFILCCIAAAMFHRTALVFLVIYPMQYIKVGRASLFLSLGVAVLCGLTGPTWRTLFNFFARTEIGTELRGGTPMLVFLWICVFAVYFLSGSSLEKPQNKLFFTMLWFAAVTQPVVYSFALWSRVLVYFKLALVFLLPASFSNLVYSEKNKSVAMPMEVIFYVLLFVLFYANGIQEFALYGAQ